MTNYREILRLHSLGLNKMEIAASMCCSRNTAAGVIRRAEACGLSYPLPVEMSDKQLAEALFPTASAKPVYKMPDYAYVHKELQRDGVTLNLLWLEYCEACWNAGELPYQSTQFNKYYNDYVAKTNATLHLNHKPGEILQVDWAGDTAAVIDTDTGEAIPAYIFVASLPYSGYSYVEAFFSMNQECWTSAHVNTFNHKPFQQKDGSRADAFEEEKAFLLPLPTRPFELSEWKTAIVSLNYHISVDKMNYSVPYEYIRQKVDVRITKNAIEIFFGGNRICSHRRLYGRAGQYSTIEEHMPPNHQQYIQWNGEHFRKWAEKIGENTFEVVSAILSGYKAEQQGYKSCMGRMKLADKYTPERLENACRKALTYTTRPSLKNIQAILSSGQDKVTEDTSDKHAVESNYSFTRGAEYYGGNK